MRWLHLSDIHFPKDDDTEKHAILSSLGTFLHSITKENKIDYVFITGDLRHAREERGEQNPEKIANKLKAFLKSAIDINPEDVYVVPGNHDLNREKNDSENIREKHASNVKIDKSEWSNHVNTQFGFYKDFILKFYGNSTYWDKIVKDMHFVVDKPDMGLILLNTAIFACDSKTEMGHLCIGSESYLKPLLKNINKDKPVFVLAHHPPDFLCKRDKDYLIDSKGGEFNFTKGSLYLCGHTHSSTNTYVGPFELINLGSTCSTDQNVENQFCIGTLENKQIRYEYYTHTGPYTWEITRRKAGTSITYDTANERLFWDGSKHYISDELTIESKRTGIRTLFDDGWSINNKEFNSDGKPNTLYSCHYEDKVKVISNYGESSDSKIPSGKKVLFVTSNELDFEYGKKNRGGITKIFKGKISISEIEALINEIKDNKCQLTQPISPERLAEFILEKEDNVSIGREYSEIGVTIKVESISEIKEPLSANFSAMTDSGIFKINEPILFRPEKYYDGVKYRWDFGDNETSDNIHPSHIYYRSGIKEVTLIIERDGERETESLQQITVIDPKLPPITISRDGNLINQITDKIVVGDELIFSPNPIEDGMTCMWKFGEYNKTSPSVNPQYTYNTPGDKTVTLNINKNKSESINITVYGKVKYDYWIETNNIRQRIIEKGTLLSLQETINKTIAIKIPQNTNSYNLTIWRNDDKINERYSIDLKRSKFSLPEVIYVDLIVNSLEELSVHYYSRLTDNNWAGERRNIDKREWMK